ncbi:Os07g0682500 [Oryza sativa Japonica Group]|uniref:Os07g0682500 protein n=1 Tax=Oryza sativa subsp. japonica TaxID=39947 RepID=Q0D3J8_ORYSJ|nr:Os07g0682500 [Oryza sativa Japonica Group]|eukprot:NP_001060661.1 Os07g0682500 [Oryza sativa Japonica Group]
MLAKSARSSRGRPMNLCASSPPSISAAAAAALQIDGIGAKLKGYWYSRRSSEVEKVGTSGSRSAAAAAGGASSNTWWLRMASRGVSRWASRGRRRRRGAGTWSG